jgi:hypothetical protein
MKKYSWHFLLVALAGWMNRQQQDVIEYLKEENRVLREKLGPGRIQLSVAQKRRLASAAFRVGRTLLKECATFFSRTPLPDPPSTASRFRRLQFISNGRPARARAQGFCESFTW